MKTKVSGVVRAKPQMCPIACCQRVSPWVKTLGKIYKPLGHPKDRTSRHQNSRVLEIHQLLEETPVRESYVPFVWRKRGQHGIKHRHCFDLSYSRSLARTGLSGLMGQPGTKFSIKPGPTTISVAAGNFEPSPMWSQCQWLQMTASELSEDLLASNLTRVYWGPRQSKHTQLV